MILFNCNHCEELETVKFVLGKMQKIKCKKCKKISWLRHSNIDPESWTDKEFRKHYKINEKTKEITER